MSRFRNPEGSEEEYRYECLNRQGHIEIDKDRRQFGARTRHAEQMGADRKGKKSPGSGDKKKKK